MKSLCGYGERAKRLGLRFLLLAAMLVLFNGCMTIKQLLYTYEYDPLNFHTVDNGVLYRSAQPTGGDLEEKVKEEGIKIKSVINLRGANPGQNWYDNEVIVSEELGLIRVDISMSAQRLPHRSDLLSLLDAFRDLPRPILVHCRAGADRTGEAAAIFALDHMKLPKWEASRQLNVYFGHIPDLYPAKTYFFNEIYQGETWARESYDPCQNDYKYYDKEEFCRGTPAAYIPSEISPAPPPPPSSPQKVKRRIDDER